jgi:unsaturated rhamnogalacturonyl hydrolase
MKICLILLAAFAAFVVAAALCDVVPAARTWFLRIGIGTLPPEDARKKMRAVAVRQLRRTPAVPVSDQTRFTLPERLRGTYKSRKVQSWQRAALLLGVAQSGGEAAVRECADDLLTADGRWKTPVTRADEAMLAYALLRTAKDPQTVRPAMDEVYAFLTATRQSDGTVPYDPRITGIRHVDTVGMICPFLWLYAETYDVPQAKELCLRQLGDYIQRGLSPVTGLPAHAFRLSDGAALGIGDWGRGCGWYALALAELLRCGADVTGPAESFARAVIPLQQKNGAWSRQLFSEPGIESTATAMIGHLCAALYAKTGAEMYRAAADGARRALLSATRKNGETDYAQGDTKAVGYYSLRLSPAPAAQGFALLLTEELR